MFESLFGANKSGMINPDIVGGSTRDKKKKIDKIMKKRGIIEDNTGRINQNRARKMVISPDKAKNIDNFRKQDKMKPVPNVQEIKEPEPKPEEKAKPDVVAPKIVCPICKSTFQYVVPEEEVKLQEDTGVGRIAPPPDIQPQPLGDINPADVKNMGKGSRATGPAESAEEFATYAFSHMNGKEKFGTLAFMFVAVGSAIYLYTR